MLKIGLTGGIACGKSNALRHFSRLGAATIDADKLAREVVLPGRPAYQAIVQEFGPEFLLADGQIDRSALASVIFSDQEMRLKLNRIVHPHVIAEEKRLIQSFSSEERPPPVLVVDAALMIEVGTYQNYDLIVVAYCPPEVQLQRLMSRDDMSESQARKRIASQMPLLKKVHYADYIVDTTGKLSDTYNQVRFIYREILERLV